MALPHENLSARSLRAAILWILVSCISFAAMWGVIRLASQSLHPFVLVFWRNIFGLMLMLVLLLRSGTQWLRTARLQIHVRRATSSLIAMLATFYAVANTPMATAISIAYAAPLLVTVGAVIFFGEKIRARRMMALVLGFIGVLIVVRPGQQPLTAGLVAAILSSCATAVSIIAIKHMTSTEDSRAIVFYSFALLLPPSLLFALPVWQWPQGTAWGLVFAIGVLALAGQYTMVRAYALAEASALTPYDFVRFSLVILIGIVWFDERLDLFTVLGGSIIMASTVYLAHRERAVAGSMRPTSAPREF